MSILTNEDLITKAKRDYPVGTVFKCLHNCFGGPITEKHRYEIDALNYIRIYGDSCGCIYEGTLGKWAEIVSKPEVKPQFIVGKWYTGFASSPESFGKLTSKIESTERFPSTEYIDPDKRYCKGSYFTGFHNNIVEANMEEVSKYLPAGHPDKLPKSKETKLKVGEWYRFEYSKKDHYFFKITKIDGDNIYCDKYYAFGSVTKSTAHMAYIQDEERFFSISMDEVYKYFPEERPKEVISPIEKLEDGKYYVIEWTNGNTYIVNGHQKNQSINLTTDTYSNDGGFNSKSYWKSIRIATKEEENWLQKCIASNKLVPKEQIMKTEENFVGRYCKAIEDKANNISSIKKGDVIKLVRKLPDHMGIYDVSIPSGERGFVIATGNFGVCWELLPIDYTPEAKTPTTAMNTYGLSVGDKLPEKVLNTYGESANYIMNDSCWQVLRSFVRDREIESFEIKSSEVVFKISGTSTVWGRAKGFKEFMENFNKPKTTELSSLPDKWYVLWEKEGDEKITQKWNNINFNYVEGGGISGKDNYVASCDEKSRYGTPITMEQFKKWVLKSSEEKCPEYVECIKQAGYLAVGAIVKCKEENGSFKWLYEKNTKYLYVPTNSIGNWDSYSRPYLDSYHKDLFKPSTKEAYEAQNKPIVMEEKIWESYTDHIGRKYVAGYDPIDEECRVGDWVTILPGCNNGHSRIVGNTYKIHSTDERGVRVDNDKREKDGNGFILKGYYTKYYGNPLRKGESLQKESVIMVDAEVYNVKVQKSASVTLKNTENEVKINVKSKQSVKLN